MHSSRKADRHLCEGIADTLHVHIHAHKKKTHTQEVEIKSTYIMFQVLVPHRIYMGNNE